MNKRLCLWAIGVAAVLIAQGARANERVVPATQPVGIDTPAATVKDWLSQTPTLTQITGVKVNPTATSVEVVLETTTGNIAAPAPKTQGKILYFDLPNAALSLGENREFRVENPATGIANIVVIQASPTYVRVQIIGTEGVPTAAVVANERGLVITPVSAADDIEITVTGRRKQPGYQVPNATTATKTDTPLRDVPGSIQVIPKEIIKDRGVTRISDALQTVSGVLAQRDFGDDTDTRFNIRGFGTESASLRNGFRAGASEIAPNNIERIEVLKGPASVLYGQFEPGGVVNFVTKQPLDKPSYSAKLTAGQFSFYEPSVDLSGPLTADKKLLYRLTGSYQNFGSFRDFVKGEQFSIAPTLSYQFSDATKLTVGYEFLSSQQTFDDGLPINPVIFRLPISRFLGDPSDSIRSTTNNLNGTLEHKFNENISLKTALGASFNRYKSQAFRLGDFDPITNQIDRFYSVGEPSIEDKLSWQTDMIAKFDTGSVRHQLLVGVELARSETKSGASDSFGLGTDVDNPAYRTLIPLADSSFKENNITNTVGIYIQDRITLLPNLKFLIGGRYDFSNAQNNFTESSLSSPTLVSGGNFNDRAFSPRVGLVYQPIEPVSLYASFSRSFVPNNATTSTGELINPTQGTQFEAGVKADLGNKFTATLAAYQITKTNILTTDLEDPNFSIPVGEAQSRGLELDIGGEIRPGWNIIASAFLNNTVITKDNNLPLGNTLINAPKNGASLWTTYEIQEGNLKGLGFGTGLFYVGDREAQLPNDFVLPSYLRADAAIFYKRDKWQFGLNFKNLFGTRYFESSQNSSLIYPGNPFAIQGTVSVEF